MSATEAALKKEKKKSKKRDAATQEGAGDASMDVDVSTNGATAASQEPAKKKSKKSHDTKEGKEVDLDPEQLSPIAKPLANKKLAKKVLRTVKKSSKQRLIRRGVKEVVKALRKGEKGIIVMAGDISPMDILTHIPVLAEDNNCPYIFVTSKELLGQASSTKRPTSCVMICILDEEKMKKPGNKKAKELAEKAKGDPEKAQELQEYKDAYSEIHKEVQALNDIIAVPVVL